MLCIGNIALFYRPVVKLFEREFYAFIDEKYPDIPHQIRDTKDLDAKIEAKLGEAIKEFKARFVAQHGIHLVAS